MLLKYACRIFFMITLPLFGSQSVFAQNAPENLSAFEKFLGAELIPFEYYETISLYWRGEYTKIKLDGLRDLTKLKYVDAQGRPVAFEPPKRIKRADRSDLTDGLVAAGALILFLALLGGGDDDSDGECKGGKKRELRRNVTGLNSFGECNPGCTSVHFVDACTCYEYVCR